MICLSRKFGRKKKTSVVVLAARFLYSSVPSLSHLHSMNKSNTISSSFIPRLLYLCAHLRFSHLLKINTKRRNRPPPPQKPFEITIPNPPSSLPITNPTSAPFPLPIAILRKKPIVDIAERFPRAVTVYIAEEIYSGFTRKIAFRRYCRVLRVR
jgi:hypothetical protein